MQTSRWLPPPLTGRTTSVMAGVVVILAFALDLVGLPIETPPLLGIAVLLVAGALLAWRGGGLVPTLTGAAAAVGLAVLLSAVAHRAFGQTPWRMYALEFLPLLALTVGTVMGAIGIGWLAGSLLRRSRPAPDIGGRGVLGALALGIAVVAGGTLLAEAVQAVVPSNAQEVRISVVDGGLRVEPGTFSATPPTFLLVDADAELMYLPVGSDAEAARRMGGDLVDRQALGGYIAPRDLANDLRRTGFAPGRYVLVAVEPEEPIDEETVLGPGDPPPGTRTMRTDIAPVEFTVTD